ncbi:MAG: SMI1/KNR4 family protein [Phycisphaerae bacterium]
MPVVITESKPPVTSVRLDAVEAKFGIHLPPEYREFLLRHNGGRAEPDGFTFTGPSGRKEDSCIHFFLSVYDGEYSNFETKFRTYKVRAKRMPDELVPIASDPGGNSICMAMSGPKTGAIYFWDHEREAAEGEAPTYANVSLVANSLAEFLGMLS